MPFGKREKPPLPRPVTPCAFDAFEPPDSTAPSVPKTSHSRVAGLLQYTRQISWVYLRVAGLAIATILSVALVTTIFLTRMPDRQQADTGSEASKVAAADPAQITQAGDPGIRFVDPPAETSASCDKATWPYIDPRCFAPAKSEIDTRREMKREVSKDTGRNGKIGPKPIDSRSQPSPDQNIPIGSMTAIAPAYPTVSSTDGVATNETGRTHAAEPDGSTRRAQKLGDAANRTGSVKKKRVRQVADAGHRTGSRAASGTETSPFIFPFSLFTQAR